MMKPKPSLSKTIQRSAFGLLCALAFILICAHTVKTISDSDSRSARMREQYLKEQRQIIKFEAVGLAERIGHETEKLIQKAKTRVEVRVSSAHAMAQNIYDQNIGVRTEDEIRKIIIDSLSPIRLDQGGGYYFVIDFDGTIKLSAGCLYQNRFSPPNRKGVVKDMIAIARSKGEGFYSYHWIKPSCRGEAIEKLGFVKAFAPFNWILGTGIYLDDLEADMQKDILEYAGIHRFGPKGNGYLVAYELPDVPGGKDVAAIYADPSQPEAAGKRVLDDDKDVMGHAFRKKMLKEIREKGECYLEYWDKKIGSPNPSPKLGFFKLAGKGRFIVSAGIYMDDVEDQVQIIRRDLDRQLWHGFLAIAGIFVAAVFTVMMLAYLLKKHLDKDFEVFASGFNLAARKSQHIDRDRVRFSELDSLAAFANRMLALKSDAEGQLKKIQERLTDAQRTAKVGHYIFDVQTDKWVCSEAVRQIFELDENYSKGLAGWLNIVHPDDRKRMADYLKHHVFETHQKFDMEYRILAKRSGREKWVHGLGDLKFDAHGTPVEMFGTLQDVTERKHMEDSLQLSQFIVDKAAVGIFQMASDGRIVNANEKAGQYLGYTVKELSCMTVFDIDATVTAENSKLTWQTLVDKGCDSFESLHRHKNGSMLPVEIISNRIEFNGKIFSISFVRDISERKAVEEALRESEARLSGIVDSMADWIWEVDINGRYLYCSSRVEKTLGYSPSEMIGKHLLDFMTPENRKQVHRNFMRCAERKEKITNLENWVICKNGKKICLLTNGVPILDEKGTLKGFRGVDKDITAFKAAEENRKALEAQLRQARKMEAIGTLAGGIAHDFNNILSGMIGYAQLAISHINSPGRATRDIEQIVKGTRRATDLIKQILTFSRQGEYRKHPFKIYVEINEALKLIRSSIPSTIEIETRLDTHKKVLADPIKIHQVIMNLCTNAYHAMRKTGGCLTVTLTEVRISRSKKVGNKRVAPGDYLCLGVRDTGHGMDEKILEKAFEPYFTTKEKGDGTGLGLALVQAIVEEHDGFLEISSQEGHGTCVSLFFPVVSDSFEAPERLRTDPLPLLTGSECILIVDDEEPVRESYGEFLKELGYRVRQACNGMEALNMFKAAPQSFDFILTDMTMPGLTGDVLAAEVLKIRPEIPVVICTGFNEDISQEKAMALGVRYLLQKPVLHQDLSALIRGILDEKD